MSITHTTRLTWTSPGGVDITASVSESADAEQNRELAIAASTPDQQFDLDFAFADLKSIFMLADQDLTIETNDGTTPDDTISLVAGVPFWWCDSSGLPNPFSADISAIFVTNAEAETATLKIRALFDSAA